MRVGVVSLLAAVLLAACGSPASAAPTPTPLSVLGQQYLAAANRANKALDVVSSHLVEDCKTLDPCKKDFAEFSRIENVFVTDLRAIRVPASMQTDLRALLDVERRVIGLDDDGAQATSLSQITTDFNARSALDGQFGDAVDHLRLDLNLSAAPSLSPLATPSASA